MLSEVTGPTPGNSVGSTTCVRPHARHRSRRGRNGTRPSAVATSRNHRGFAFLGASGDMAALAVSSLRHWLVTCDAGGPDACASRAWKSG